MSKRSLTPFLTLDHDAVRNALIKDGWTITDDPYVLGYEDVVLFADLGAERTLAAERRGRRIVVEIESFVGASPIREFETALGQYELYRGLLERVEPDRELFLAVSDTIYSSFFQRDAIQVIVHRYDIKLLVVALEREEIIEWTS